MSQPMIPRVNGAVQPEEPTTSFTNPMEEQEFNPIPQEEVIQTPPIRNDLRGLFNFGYVEREIDVNGWLFKMRTLKGSEITNCFSAVAHLDEITKAAQLRIESLARAIVCVNNLPLESLYKGPVTSSVIDQKRSVLGALPQALVQRLYLIFEGLMTESDKLVNEIDGNELKNS